MNKKSKSGEITTEGAVRKALEFSQMKVSRIMWMFAAHVLITVLAAVFMPSSAEMLGSLFGTCLAFYLAGIAGYDIKAALENVQKIKNAAQAFEGKDAGDGNG